ncbi:MAG: baseplate J/gp47 family protein, partial [Oscillospiraceae bacterium]|nr:baseplate J/gp47 family protein [Oscillospiraceae bacterium]
MLNSRENFPDISFVDTDTERLVNSLIRGYEMFTGRTLFRGDPTRKFIEWIADIIIQERILIDEAAKRNVPRFADGEYLDSLADLFNHVERLQAVAARTTMRFHISIPLPGARIIPAGTRVTVNGEITFETTEAAHIKPGETFADAPAICQTVGIIGNGFVAGQITQVIDLYQFYSHAENITTSEGGADEESDEAFYDRMRDSFEAFSTAGSVGAYIFWV